MEVKLNMPHCPLYREVREKVNKEFGSLSVKNNGGEIC